MKLCPKCAWTNDNDAEVCESCGESLAKVSGNPESISAVARESFRKAKEAAKATGLSAGGGDIFVDQDEHMTAVIGTNYLQNFLSGGSVSYAVGVLTQKRFYFKGQNFSGTGKDMKHTTEEGVVSIDDIAFTMFSHVRNIGALVWAVLLLLAGTCLLPWGDELAFLVGMGLLAVSLVFFVSYFISRKSLFVISFPGGSFGFDIRYYPIADIRDFQRQLHLMKDHIKENA